MEKWNIEKWKNRIVWENGKMENRMVPYGTILVPYGTTWYHMVPYGTISPPPGGGRDAVGTQVFL